MSEELEVYRSPLVKGPLTRREQERMDRLNILFKLHDVDAEISFETSLSTSGTFFRKKKPFVVVRQEKVGPNDWNNNPIAHQRRFRRVKDAEQFAQTLFKKVLGF